MLAGVFLDVDIFLASAVLLIDLMSGVDVDIALLALLLGVGSLAFARLIEPNRLAFADTLGTPIFGWDRWGFLAHG
ncbi:hypothetical protein X743_16875 [Mesorhizobium sp. LNHC252B00]|nr:hypothetical protein X743_16875 [Mesorhizobium sp. LNHC252B00]